MSLRERSGTDDFTRAQRFGRGSAPDGCTEYRQAQGGSPQAVSPGSFFDKFAVFQNAYLESRQLVRQGSNGVGPHRHALSDYECRMKPERCYKIRRLKLPLRERTVDYFKPHCHPSRGCESSGGIEVVICLSNRLLQTENNLGFDLRGTGMCKCQRC